MSLLAYERNKTPKPYPLFQLGSQFVEDKSFRPAKDLHESSFDWKNPEAEILIWGEHGFEVSSGDHPEEPAGVASKLVKLRSRWFGKSDTAASTNPNRFRKTFMGTVTGLDWPNAAAGPDGFPWEEIEKLPRPNVQ